MTLNIVIEALKNIEDYEKMTKPKTINKIKKEIKEHNEVMKKIKSFSEKEIVYDWNVSREREGEIIYKEITLKYIKDLEKLKEIINLGSIDYNKCKCCNKIIKNWMEATKKINELEEYLNKEKEQDENNN